MTGRTITILTCLLLSSSLWGASSDPAANPPRPGRDECYVCVAGIRSEGEGLWGFHKLDAGDPASYASGRMSANPPLSIIDERLCGFLAPGPGEFFFFNRSGSIEEGKQLYRSCDDPSRPWAGRCVLSNGASLILTYTPYNGRGSDGAAGPAVTAAGKPVTAVFNAARVYFVTRRGGGRWQTAGDSPLYSKIPYRPKGWGDIPETSYIYTYLGPPDDAVAVFPPPVDVHSPYDILNNPTDEQGSNGGLFHLGIFPFPVQGHDVVVPFGYCWITNRAVRGIHGKSAGFAVRSITDFRCWTRGLELTGCDCKSPATGTGPVVSERCTLSSTMAYRYRFWQTSTAGLPVDGLPERGVVDSPPVHWSFCLSTSQCGDSPRIYAVRTEGNLDPEKGPVDGASALFRFEKGPDGWRRVRVPADAPYVVNLYRDDDGFGWNKRTHPMPDQFRSLGVSARTSGTDWIYLSSARPGNFAVSSGFFLTGGTLWLLDPSTGLVSWQERDDTRTPPRTSTGNIETVGEITRICADRMNNVYFLARALEPSVSAIETSFLEGLSGAEENWADNPFFDYSYEQPGDRVRVVFDQFSGFELFKSDLCGPPVRMGFVPDGKRRWSRTWNRRQLRWEGAFTARDGFTGGTGAKVFMSAPGSSRAVPHAEELNIVDITLQSRRTGEFHHANEKICSPVDSGNGSVLSDEDLDQAFGLENAPRYGSLARPRFGRSVMNSSPVDEDLDGRAGRFAYGLALAHPAGDPLWRLRYSWTIKQRGAKKSGKDLTAALLRWENGAAPAAWSLNNTPAARGRTWYTVDEASDHRLVFRRILMPRFTCAGCYVITLTVAGACWLPAAGCAKPSASFFESSCRFVVDIRKARPGAGGFVDDLEIVDFEGRHFGELDESSALRSNPSKIVCRGIVRFFGGVNDDGDGMPCAPGVGTWDYIWDYRSSRHPVNYDVVAGEGAADRTVVNNGTGPGGTGSGYDLAARDAGADPQQYHDWFGLKYEWILRYRLPDGSDSGEIVFRRGNLAEIYHLHCCADPAQKKALIGEGAQFLRLVDRPTRTYEFRIPLIYDASGAGRIFDPPAAPLGPAAFFGRPERESAAWNSLVQPSWFVPTEPSCLEFTCRVYYPRVTWTRTVGDGAEWTLVDWPAATDEGRPFRVGDGRVITLCKGGYCASFGEPGRKDPLYVPGKWSMPFDDDYYELRIIDLTAPRLTVKVPTGAPRTVFRAELGKMLDSDLEISVRDNNPFVHWDDDDGASMSPERPLLAEYAFETGSDARTKNRLFGGLGLNSPRDQYASCPTFGFDTALNQRGDDFKRGFPFPDYPGDLSIRKPPSSSSFIVPGTDICRGDPDSTQLPGNDAEPAWFFHLSESESSGDDRFPELDPAAGQSLVTLGAEHPYAWNDVSSESGNFRGNVFIARRNRFPVPLFAGANELKEQKLRLAVFGQALALPGGASFDEGRHLSDSDRNKPGAQYTLLARVQAADTCPPGVQVEIREKNDINPVHFLVYPDSSRDYSLAQADTRDFLVIKKSPDRRTVADFHDAFTMKSHVDFGGALLAADGTASITVRFDKARVIGDRVVPFEPRPSDIRRLFVPVRRDEQFSVFVRACDNACPPSAIHLEIEGGQEDSTSDTPLPRFSRANTVGGLRVLTATHYYRRQGCRDLVRVEARDPSGNGAILYIRFETVGR